MNIEALRREFAREMRDRADEKALQMLDLLEAQTRSMEVPFRAPSSLKRPDGVFDGRGK